MPDHPSPAPEQRRAPRTLVFSHANGFPAGTYRVLFEAWRAAGWRVEAIDKFGHDPRYAVTSNWPHLRDELIHFIVERDAAPAWLVGHSLGGFLSVLAASHRPELVSGVVLLDAPVICGWRAAVLGMSKWTGLAQRLGPGSVSRQRRHEWPSAEAAYQHFAAKPAFARWDPRVLRDYIAAGMQASGPAAADGINGPATTGPAGVRLAFDRAVETRIYDTLPHHLGGLLRRHPLRCPLVFIGGSESEEARRAGLNGTRLHTRGQMLWLQGSHLFPFERPADTIAAVLGVLNGDDLD